MFPELAFRAIGHCLFGQLRLFIAFSPDGGRTDGLQLSFKLYGVRELWPGLPTVDDGSTGGIGYYQVGGTRCLILL